MMTTSVEARVLTDDVGEPILQKIDKALCELSNARDDVETGKHQSAILSFLRMAKEYIESVRDDIEVVTSAYLDNLSQPQPVAKGEAVAYVNPDELEALVRDAKKFGKTQYCIDAFAKPAGLNTAPLYATPTIPTGHRVVPDGLEKDAARYQWLRDRLCVRWEMALDGEKHEALGMRPGFGFLRSTMDPAKGWTLPEFFDDHRQKTDNAIDKAMLAAAPDAGGV